MLAIRWLDALKSNKKIIQENTIKQNMREKPGLKLSAFKQLGPGIFPGFVYTEFELSGYHMEQCRVFDIAC